MSYYNPKDGDTDVNAELLTERQKYYLSVTTKYAPPERFSKTTNILDLLALADERAQFDKSNGNSISHKSGLILPKKFGAAQDICRDVQKVIFSVFIWLSKYVFRFFPF